MACFKAIELMCGSLILADILVLSYVNEIIAGS